VILILDFRPVRDREPILRKLRTMSSVTCVSGWSLPSRGAARQGEIGRLFGSAAFELRVRRGPFGEGGLDFRLGVLMALPAAASPPWTNVPSCFNKAVSLPCEPR